MAYSGPGSSYGNSIGAGGGKMGGGSLSGTAGMPGGDQFGGNGGSGIGGGGWVKPVSSRAKLGQLEDILNIGNTPEENFWGWVGRNLGGAYETMPSGPKALTQTRADWNWDPVGAIGSGIGMATGLGMIPAGVIAGLASDWLGNPLAINLGPDPFGSSRRTLSGIGGFGSERDIIGTMGRSGEGGASGGARGGERGDGRGKRPVPPVVPPVTPPVDDDSGPSAFQPYTGDYFTYGQGGPEWGFYNPSPRVQFLPSSEAGDFFNRARGGRVRGPGTSMSDSIPARLSAGEYVLPENIVRGIGDGSNSRGADKLDRIVHKPRKRPRRGRKKGLGAQLRRMAA